MRESRLGCWKYLPCFMLSLNTCSGNLTKFLYEMSSSSIRSSHGSLTLLLFIVSSTMRWKSYACSWTSAKFWLLCAWISCSMCSSAVAKFCLILMRSSSSLFYISILKCISVLFICFSISTLKASKSQSCRSDWSDFHTYRSTNCLFCICFRSINCYSCNCLRLSNSFNVSLEFC